MRAIGTCCGARQESDGRRQRPRVTAISLCLAVLALGSGEARGADQGLTGKKLLINPNKVVIISKDPGISIAGSDPVGGAHSSLRIDAGSGPAVFNLLPPQWSAIGPATVFTYKGGSTPTGPSWVKIVKLKSGLLKVVGASAPFALPIGAATIKVVLSLDGGSNDYCMSFSGTSDGTRFLVKDAAAAACPVCGNGVRDGGEDCDGAAAAACPGSCLADCTCPVCGNGVREGSEACDGSDDSVCPSHCNNLSCTCPQEFITQCVGGGPYPTCGGSCSNGQQCAPIATYNPGFGPYLDCLCVNPGHACPPGQALEPYSLGCAPMPTCFEHANSYPACDGWGTPPGQQCQAIGDGFSLVGLCGSVNTSYSCSGGDVGACPAGQTCMSGASSTACRNSAFPTCGTTEGASCGSCGSGVCAVESGSTFGYSGPGSVCANLATVQFQACASDADCPAGMGCGSYLSATLCASPCP